MKKWVLFILTIFVCLVTTTPTYAVVDKKNADLDPLVGTAGDDIERMIEAGKGLIGSVNYYMDNHLRTNVQMLTYDYANDASSTGALGIDCSEFVAYALSKGYGLQWGGDSSTPPATTGMINTFSTPTKYMKKISKWSEAKRGDIVMTNDYGHVVIYLGNNMILGSNGDNNSSKTKGPSIVPAQYFSIAQGAGYQYNTISLPGKLKDVKLDDKTNLQKGHPSDDLSFKSSGSSSDKEDEGGKEEESNSKYVGEDAWKNKIVNFQNNAFKQSFNGIERGSTGFINSAFISGMNKTSRKAVEYAYIAMMFITTGLFLFMVTMTMIYLVVLPNGVGGYKLMNFYEKTTGLDASVNRKNTMELLGRLGITTIFVAILYANAVPVIVSGFLNVVIMLLNLF